MEPWEDSEGFSGHNGAATSWQGPKEDATSGILQSLSIQTYLPAHNEKLQSRGAF